MRYNDTLLREILETRLKRAYKNLRDSYIAYNDKDIIANTNFTGGTVRRLYMLRNGIPLTDYDRKEAVKADVDVFISDKFDPSRITSNGSTPFKFVSVTDTRINSVFGDFTLQEIMASGLVKDELLFDLDCCRFVYDPDTTEVRSLREDTHEDFFFTSIHETSLEAIPFGRLFKYRKLGFKPDVEQLQDIIKRYKLDETEFKTLLWY